MVYHGFEVQKYEEKSYYIQLYCIYIVIVFRLTKYSEILKISLMYKLTSPWGR